MKRASQGQWTCGERARIHFGHRLQNTVTGFTKYGFWPRTKCHFQNVTTQMPVQVSPCLLSPFLLPHRGASKGKASNMAKRCRSNQHHRRKGGGGRRDVIGRNTRSVNEEFTFIRNFRPYSRPNKLPSCAFCVNSE